MAVPLDYARPNPSRPSWALFWLVFVAAHFVSSYMTDEVSHWGMRRSDGGVFVIGLFLLVPSALAFLVAKAGARSRLRMSPLIGVAWGALGPPLGFGILNALDVI